MFPCKVKIDQLDRKSNLLDFNTTKAETKGKVKKVAAKLGEKTTFYFIADYFEKNGKAIGDFLTLGDSPKLEKHFLQNEMKNSAVSVMEKKQDIKTAAMGEICVKNVDGKNVIHFEPHDKAKIPVGKWPKILKKLKGFFAGMKAVVVVEGQVIEAEAGDDEADETDGEETGADDSNANTPNNADSEKNAAAERVQMIQELADNYKDMLAGFKEVQEAEHDVDEVKSLYKNLLSWEKTYQAMDAVAKEKLAKFYQSYAATLEGVKKILKADQAIGTKVDAVQGIVKQYLEMEDHESSDAVKMHDDAAAQLDEIIKYCKFIKDTDLQTKCETLKTILAS